MGVRVLLSVHIILRMASRLAEGFRSASPRRRMMVSDKGLVKTEFDFGWKKWDKVPEIAKLLLEHQKGDVLDVGCATCQLCSFLREHGWRGRYHGIDARRYEGYGYPEDIDLIIGDALKVQFPEVDTVVLYDILEHVDDPVALLRKSLGAAKKNVLIAIPLRNEEMWRYGVVETHQLDRTHMHCGFSKEEALRMVELAGGKISVSKDMGRATAIVGVNLWNGRLPKKIFYLMDKVFSSKTYYWGLWCEVVRA